VNTPPRILRVGEEPPPLHQSKATEPTRPKAPLAGKPKGKPSSQGRFGCINAFLDATMAGLGRAELAVWLLLWRDTKPDGLARTSQGDLARRAGCNPRTVRRALKALECAGLLSVVSRGGLNRGVSVYRVHPLVRGNGR
jgi:hypothetical protein